jgi:hypothetical protein
MEEECEAVLIKLENQFLFFKCAAQFDLKIKYGVVENRRQAIY